MSRNLIFTDLEVIAESNPQFKYVGPAPDSEVHAVVEAVPSVVVAENWY